MQRNWLEATIINAENTGSTLSIYSVNNVGNQHNPTVHNTFIWKPSVRLSAYQVLAPATSVHPGSIFSAAQDLKSKLYVFWHYFLLLTTVNMQCKHMTDKT